jgi:hypothetical protein
MYHDHPQKDAIDLLGEVAFPNLSFSLNEFDFGCTVNDVDKQIALDITNTSKVEASYSWSFEESPAGRSLPSAAVATRGGDATAAGSEAPTPRTVASVATGSVYGGSAYGAATGSVVGTGSIAGMSSVVGTGSVIGTGSVYGGSTYLGTGSVVGVATGSLRPVSAATSSMGGAGNTRDAPVGERRPMNEVFDVLPIKGTIPPGLDSPPPPPLLFSPSSFSSVLVICFGYLFWLSVLVSCFGY